jgi:hypothetical protein
VDGPTCPSSLRHRGHGWHRVVPYVGGVRLPGDEHYSLYDQVRATLPPDSYDSQALIRSHYPAVAPSEGDALMPFRWAFYFMQVMSRREQTIFMRRNIYLRTSEHFFCNSPCTVDRRSRYLVLTARKPRSRTPLTTAGNRPSVKTKKSDHQLCSLSACPLGHHHAPSCLLSCI